jgi:hypothetical protein
MKNLKKLFGTQKQWICVVVLALFCAGTAFSQARQPAPAPAQPARPGQPAAAAASAAKKNAIGLDVNYLLRGFIESDDDADTFYFGLAPNYEYLIAPNISIGGELAVVFGQMFDRDILYAGLGFNTRVYLVPNRMDGWFVGATVGFALLAVENADGDLKCDPEKGLGWISLYTVGRIGYKFHLVEGFYIEPALNFTYTKGEYSVLGNNGWSASIRLGFSF